MKQVEHDDMIANKSLNNDKKQEGKQWIANMNLWAIKME